jgi:hypothetical protein
MRLAPRSVKERIDRTDCSVANILYAPIAKLDRVTEGLKE